MFNCLQWMGSCFNASQASEPPGPSPAAAPTLTAPGLLGALPPRRQGIQPDELPLAAYAVRRAVDSRPIQGAALERLRSAHDTVIATRATMSEGRGNVRPDIEASQGRSTWHAEAGRALVDRLADKDPSFCEADLTAVAMFAKAGNCGEYAGVAVHLHVAKLAQGETVHHMEHPGEEHDFAEVRGNTERENTIVMDPWCTGPAVLADDSRYAKDLQVLGSVGHYQFGDGPGLQNMVSRRTEQIQREMIPSFKEDLNTLQALDYRHHPDSAHEPRHVLDDEFVQRVAAKMAAPGKSPGAAQLRNEILAAGVARSMGLHHVKEAVKAAPMLVEAARKTPT